MANPLQVHSTTSLLPIPHRPQCCFMHQPVLVPSHAHRSRETERPSLGGDILRPRTEPVSPSHLPHQARPGPVRSTVHHASPSVTVPRPPHHGHEPDLTPHGPTLAAPSWQPNTTTPIPTFSFLFVVFLSSPVPAFFTRSLRFFPSFTPGFLKPSSIPQSGLTFI